MYAVQNGKNRGLEKPIPGCLGRMVNLFDLNGGVAGNRLLTDKPHRDGSLSRSQSDVARMSPSEDQIEDKEIVSELRRNNSKMKANGTPMKMLIAEEMSKDMASKHNPPSVVAKLMGLDGFPSQLPVSTAQRNYSGRNAQSAKGTPLNNFHHRSGSLDTQMECEFYQYPEQNECKDVYEVWQNRHDMNSMRSKSPQMGRCNETSTDKVAFVRQKFIEAKCLSLDEKCHHSRQFQDALEVLSSNTDLVLKFLQEPKPMLSEHIYNLQSIPAPSETKRITVLKPSKMVDNCEFIGTGKNENVMKRTNQVSQVNRIDKTHPDLSSPAASWKTDTSVTQPTRIVVLKPSTVKSHELKALSSPPCTSPRVLHGNKFVGVPEDNDAQESREVAKSITQQMRENLAGHRRDETLLSSSVFSNGYIGDESSFNKSENEYAAMNLSDSEVMSPMSRHSWDYINRFNSPYSCSSLSRASYSPESSVSREAKKRLSERWAMVTSHRSHQEQRHLRRSSSTLGEMLALSDAKKPGTAEGEGKKGPRDLNCCPVEDTNKNEGIDSMPKNLVRSKSVPVSSTTFASHLNLDTSQPETAITDVPREKTKERSTKSLLKGKVSSLFFSRNKKLCKQKPRTDESHSGGKLSHSIAKVDNNRSECLNGTGLDCSSPDLRESSGEATSPDLVEKQGLVSSEFGLSLPFGNPSENHDQPSPVSVLETSFEEDEHLAQLSLGNIKADRRGGELPFQPIRSNLIDKSPPIGSVARTLSWDDSCVDTATSSYSLNPPVSMQRTEEEEREWLFFIQTLLSMAGLDEVQSDSLSSRWHSPDSPLDPLLRDKYINLNEKETVHEAKRRQRRSTRKLVFDCVNAALIDIDTCHKTIAFSGAHNTIPDGSSIISADRVWGRIKEWFPSAAGCLSDDGVDDNNLTERMVRQEAVGKGWHEYLRLEAESIGKEIEGKLLEEIVQDAVVGLADTM
ncbi:PREDICTED: uncharacterized protein LOC109161751 isoform X2 [Ipomoea nil]|nr:PREDICTED: uncharacterized protein LOC109161751 isoform X2 [Ipomoea nil]XP_019165815.1 PREDICTED: uncharacterized protein LOC109161751 isoform X2 [Ipomoea nil]XP_019165821.1 PREDICTED: uncharacterized protein LOC109161751 isoform X2 [Ipomoea nil]